MLSTLVLDGILLQRSHSHQQGNLMSDNSYDSLKISRVSNDISLLKQFDDFSRELCVKSLLEIMDMFCHRLRYV